MVCATPSFIEKDSIFWYICRITMWSIIYTRLYWKGFGLLIHLPYYLANYVIYHIHRIILKRIRSFDTFAILLGKLCDLSYTQEDERNELKKKLFWHYNKNVIFIFMHFFSSDVKLPKFSPKRWWIPLQWYMEENGTGKPQRHLK